MLRLVIKILLIIALTFGPNMYSTIMSTCGKHLVCRTTIPGNACDIALKTGRRLDAVQHYRGVTFPDEDLADCEWDHYTDLDRDGKKTVLICRYAQNQVVTFASKNARECSKTCSIRRHVTLAQCEIYTMSFD